MNPNRKRSKPIVIWFHRNALLFILIAIIVASMGVGAAGYALLTNTKCVKDTPSTTTPLVSDTTHTTTESIPIVEEPVVFYYDVPLSEDLQDYIRELCKKHDVPMSLIMAMIEVESSFRSDVISGTNDYGLMQINKINHEWLTEEYGITDFLDPYQNVFCGITIIAGHLEKTDGDIALALMRYNCGATGAKRLWDKGIYSTSYTEKILAAMEVYGNEI